MIMRKYARFALIGLLIFGLFCGGALGATLEANFSANVSSGTVPLTVDFTDLSTNTTSWEWDVGDGTANYTTQNVIHTYNSVGTYTVTLTAINLNGSDTEIKNNYITVSGLVPFVDFSANVTSGDVPLTVNFTDLSTNTMSWEWDVGDGTANYTTQNVIHTYNSVGTYTVTFTATNLNGSDTEIKNNYITVSALTLPFADFSANVTSGVVPLTVNFTDLSTNIMSWEWDVGDGTANYTTQNVIHTYNSAGTYTVTLTATNLNGSDTEIKNNYVTVSGLVPFANFSANVTSGVVPLTVNFTDLSTNTISWEWDVGDGTANYTTQNVTHAYNSAGTYTVTLTATNLNGSDAETKNNYITVSGLAVPSANFSTNVTEGIVPLSVEFIDLSTNTISWEWDVGDGTANYTTQNVTHIYNSTGTYTVTLTATNPNGSDIKTETINVHPKTYYSGDRIWDALTSPSLEYTWTAESYSGFYYDLDSGFSSETMTIKLGGYSDRSINSGDLKYSTKPITTDFEYDDWNSYQVIGFMAEKYFAGYTVSTDFSGGSMSLLSDSQLSKVLIDNDDDDSVYSGSAIILDEGYALNVVEIDRDGNQVFVTLTKDGDEKNSRVVNAGDTYVYKKDLGSSDDVPIIAVHFASIFRGMETNAVFVDGIFQISDEYLTVRDGDNYGEMEVDSVSSTEIKMINDGSFSLGAGNTVDIMGKLKFLVADDSSTLRFAPFVDMSDPGTYELRGTVAEKEYTWTPLNFEGFYYNIDEGLKTESLKVESLSGSSIPSSKLVYTTIPASVGFEYTDSAGWTTGYEVIGFMAEKYFAGYPTGTFGISSPVSMMSDGQLSKVLIDNDKSSSIYSGSALILDEGYTLSIVEIDRDGNQVFVTLSKDGDEKDSVVVNAGDTYVYKKDLGSFDDVPIIAVYFKSIFRGIETNAVFVDGIFQISDEYITIEEDDTYGKMKVETVDSTKIEMMNDDSITLSRGKSIPIMGDILFKVADDSSNVRYYPYVEIETAPLDSLDISMPASVKQGDYVTVTVKSRGATVSDVAVKFDDNNVGKTSAEGIISHKPALSGIYTVTVEKEGYVSASGQVEVISPLDETKKMSIEVSPDVVYEGNQLTISIIKSIDGEVIDGVDVSYDGKSLGTTSSDDTLSYTVKEPGMHKLTATKTGYLDSELNLEILALEAKFEFSNLVISPLEAKIGKDVTITLNASNTGKAAGDYNVDLMVNGNLTESQQITLDVGESTTIEFTVAKDEPGTYLVEVNILSGTFVVLEKAGGTAVYVLGILGVFAAIAVGYMFTAGGWTVEMVTAKVAEFIESVR